MGMDKYGHVYRAEEVPVEDAARLDGYLRGLAEVGAARRERKRIRKAAKAARKKNR